MLLLFDAAEAQELSHSQNALLKSRIASLESLLTIAPHHTHCIDAGKQLACGSLLSNDGSCTKNIEADPSLTTLAVSVFAKMFRGGGDAVAPNAHMQAQKRSWHQVCGQQHGSGSGDEKQNGGDASQALGAASTSRSSRRRETLFFDTVTAGTAGETGSKQFVGTLTPAAVGGLTHAGAAATGGNSGCSPPPPPPPPPHLFAHAEHSSSKGDRGDRGGRGGKCGKGGKGGKAAAALALAPIRNRMWRRAIDSTPLGFELCCGALLELSGYQVEHQGERFVVLLLVVVIIVVVSFTGFDLVFDFTFVLLLCCCFFGFCLFLFSFFLALGFVCVCSCFLPLTIKMLDVT